MPRTRTSRRACGVHKLDSTRVANGFGRRSRCGAGASDRLAVTAGWDVREVLGLDFPGERLREIRCRKLVSHDGMNLSGSGSPSELVDETVEDVTTFDSANWIAQAGWPGRVEPNAPMGSSLVVALDVRS